MKYELEFTRQYLKDLKLARKRGLDENKLNEVILKLITGEELYTTKNTTVATKATNMPTPTAIIMI